MKIACIKCNDTGQYLGNGMIMTDCNLCKDKSSSKNSPPTLDKIDRKSESYQKALRDLMDLNPKMSKRDAEKLFDKTYEEV